MLTDAAIYGKVDKLVGLKENVIIGKIIPAYHADIDEAKPEELSSSEVPVLVGGESPAPEVGITEAGAEGAGSGEGETAVQ